MYHNVQLICIDVEQNFIRFNNECKENIARRINMAKSDRTVVSSAEDLEKLFQHDETRKSIADKLVMPRPNDGGKAVTILYSKGDDGQPGVVHVVKNEKFESGGQGVFMMVAEVEHPEVELQMGVNKSLFNSFDRLCNSEGWKLTELPGKIVHITANYYPKIKCNKCNGRGCAACENTGNSTVFNVRARHDLMTPTKNVKGKVADEF